jgi:hypothetical protein
VAEIIVMRHLVKPNDWENSPYVDTHHFFLEVTRRDRGEHGATGEWSVSEFGFTGYGFTKAGERVSLRGHDEPNRHLAVFPEPEALLLAQDIVDGRVEAVGFTPLSVAAAAFRARQQETKGADDA